MNELIVALAKAEREFDTIIKNRQNYNKGKYADLTAILDAVKPALLNHGVVIVQSPATHQLEDGTFAVDIVTTLHHGESGKEIQGILMMPCGKGDPQTIGSAITYGRRYALVSMLSLSSEEDDDGESAQQGSSQRQVPPRQRQQRQAPVETPAEPTGYAWSDKPDSVLIQDGYQFSSPDEAIAWGMAMNVFDAVPHCRNAYNKVKADGKPKSAGEMWQLWVNDVARRVNERKEEAA